MKKLFKSKLIEKLNGISDIAQYVPLTTYFLDTYTECEKNDTMSWLKSLNDDYFKHLYFIVNNLIFNNGNVNNNDEYHNELMDFLMLSLILHEFETGEDINTISVSSNEEDALILSLFIKAEYMRRNKMVTIRGDGKITNMSKMQVKLTAKGKKYHDEYKDASKLLGDIVSQIN